MVNVAIFSDHDVRDGQFDARTLQALRHAPPDLRLRIYTSAPMRVEQPDYVALCPVAGLPPLFAYVRRARLTGTDLVHVETWGPIGVAGVYVAWRLGVPLVGSVQGAMTTAGQRWLYARCARLLVSSREQREGLVRAGFLSRSIDVCSPGVDAEAFSPVRQSDRLRDRWHVSSRRLAVACVASATDDRTIRLAEVFRDRLYARGVEHAMVFVTEGVPAAGVRHRLGDAVFTGPLSEETLAVTLASADVALFPVATAAANSLALMAQASGLPAIVAGGGPALEQVIEGVTASACRANAPDEWAQAVAILARTPPLLQAMRRHAREHAARKTWPLALDPVFRAYRRASSGLAVLVPCLLPLDEQRPDVNPLPEV